MKPLLTALLVAATGGLVQAASAKDVNMTFHGTLVAPPCTISNGQTIEVDFGDDLGVEKIDGNNYKQNVNYSITCTTGYTPYNLAVVVDTASPASFDSSAIQTDKPDLGIRILVDGQPATFAQRVAVSDSTTPPKIEAVPVQSLGAVLSAGTFEASMTLRVDYI